MDRSAPRARSRGETAGLKLVPALHGERRASVEAFIRRRFAERYQAKVRHFMPRLLGLESGDASLHGAVGYRSAGEFPLFLERYLDVPIEQAIGQRFDRPVARDEIVEVGNLAAAGVGTARRLIVALTDLLAAEGFRWVAFTGTATLLNSFLRLGLSPCVLGLADPARVGDELPDWGTYYDDGPQVMAGEILGGHQRLSKLGVYGHPDGLAWFDSMEACHVARH
ncbi:thermostable hemolysin [Quisquiliibacterium transsilvanicum]|uniref:Thermostable hemolysin n=1 Tax=Quisquiliibacterium transsilvanicum TaxID=1549638 RepID=A0A7W8HG50_9BURK|nr:thermostable hemolysin [Quisquiliibacterium transsilvanicum]MBB5271237.1 hypothetical protein [Quisquiliibacterium transsilvanicum]